MIGHDPAQRHELVLGRVPRRHHVAFGIVVRARPRRRQAERARPQALRHHALHRDQVVGGGGALRRPFAHDDAAHRRVPDEEARVGCERAVDAVEVVAERRPVPRHTGRERGGRHALDAGEHVQEVVAVLRPQRRDREAAVPADDGRHPVQRRRAQRRVEEDLGVVVRVDVDEAGRDDLSTRIDRSSGGFVDLADCDDSPVTDADGAGSRGCARSVDDGSIADEHVQHRVPLGPRSGAPTIVHALCRTHSRAALPSSPVRAGASVRRSRAVSERKVRVSPWSRAVSNPVPAVTSPARCARRPRSSARRAAPRCRSRPTSPIRRAIAPRSSRRSNASSDPSTCSSTMRRPASTCRSTRPPNAGCGSRTR